MLGTLVLTLVEALLLDREAVFGPTFLFIVATFLPPLALTVRRLHDSNWPGWWAVPSALTFPCSLFAMAFGEDALFSYLGPGSVAYGLAT